MNSLTDQNKQFLLQVARQSLVQFLGSGKMAEFSSEQPTLCQPRATFVTLWRRESGKLRGCRGETAVRHPLIQSVALMAIAAATDDPRFQPVKLLELARLRIEINALTPLKPIKPEEVEIGRHGLKIAKGVHAGLLLPEVPVRYGWSAETFLRGLCRKAGLPEDAWQNPDAQLWGFEAEEWGEI